VQETYQTLRLALLALAAASLVACNSDNGSPSSVAGDGTGDSSIIDSSTEDGGSNDGVNVAGDGSSGNGGADGNNGDGAGSNNGDGAGGDSSDGAGNPPSDDDPNNPSSEPAVIPPPVAGEVAPTLPDPFAPPVPGPSGDDPFNYGLEIDTEVAVAGGAPTTPKNLRIDLVSNDWGEINWAPSNDDGEVVAYNVYRSDGVTYEVARDTTDANLGVQAEIDKFFATTAFIDCNYTRFSDRIHNCNTNSPKPGQTYSYTVTAIDDEGNESGRSNVISITYHDKRGAPIPRYEDPFLGPNDDFAQRNNLAETRFFLDEFDTMFEDEFDGDTIDDTKWTTGLVWGDSRIINGEQQYFVNTQLQPDFGYNPFNLTGDSLIIEAIPVPDSLRQSLPPVCEEADPTGLDRCEFLSGALSSHGPSNSKYGFIYGYTEARMRVSGTPGALSSFYLYHRYPGEGVFRHGPEIDIIEYLGENPFGDEDAFQTYHYQDRDTGLVRSAPTMFHANESGELYSEDWHTFSVLWEPQLVIWYIDGVEIKRITGPQVSRQPMNLVSYLVAGSGWAPTPDITSDIFPLQLEIDYIKVMQRPVYQGTSTYDP